MPTRDFALQLEVGDANGPSRGRIPHAKNIRLQYPVMDQAVLTFDYPALGPKASRLIQPCDIRVWVSPTGRDNWQWDLGPKFLCIADDRDRAQSANGLWSFTCPSWDFLLTKAKVLQAGGGTGIWDPATGPRVFEAVTPGYIVNQLHSEKSSRSAVAWSIAGTSLATQDSVGNPWPATITREYVQGTSIREVLQGLADEGRLSWEMKDTVLYLYAPGTTGLASTALQWDLTAASTMPTVLHPGAVSGIPTRRTWEAHAYRLFQEGEGGLAAEATNPVANNPWGVWEEYSTHGGVSDTAELAALASKFFTDTPSPLVETTVSVPLSAADGAGGRPLLDYRPGQVVKVRDTPGAVPVNAGVKAVTIEQGGNGAFQAHVTLDYRVLPRDVRTKQHDNTKDRSVVQHYSAHPASTGPAPSPSSAWAAVGLVAGWANVGFGWPALEYRYVDGYLEVLGLIQRTGAATAAGAAITTALPANLWTPTNRRVADVWGSTGAPVAGFRIDYGAGTGVFTTLASIGTNAYVWFNERIPLR